MSIIHLIVFLLQFFLFVPLFFVLFIKTPKGNKNKKIFLVVALISIGYASVDAYFHRYLIMSDFYYAQGEWKKSGEIAEKGFNALEGKSEFYEFVYGQYSLYRKMKRAEEKTKAPEQNGPALIQGVTEAQEAVEGVVDQERPVVDEKIAAEQETVEQEDSAVNEEVSVEQEAVEQEDSAIDDEEMSTEQEAVEQEEPIVNEGTTETQEDTDQAEPEGAAGE